MCEHRVIVSPQTREHICARCGLVFGPTLSSLPGRDREEFQRACDLVTTYRHDRNLGSVLYPLPETSSVRPEVRQWWNRVSRYLRYTPSAERRQIALLCEVQLVCEYLGLPGSVRKDLDYAAHRLGRIKGTSRLRTLMLMTYLSCRQRGVGRSLREIDAAFQELFGDDYRRVRDPRIDRARSVLDLGTRTRKRMRALERVLGYQLRLNIQL